MKIITKHYPLYEIEVEAENELEALYDTGDIIEICIDGEYKDCRITKKLDNNRYLVE